jgi:hypothetical protein
MATHEATLDQLVADAKLVLNYCARTGRLSDETLATAIEEAEVALASKGAGKAQREKPSAALLRKLTTALSRTLKTIAPVTLIDLGSAWRPYPGAWSRTGRVAFAVFAFFLIVITSYYTQIYTEANSILGQLTEIQTLNWNDKSERLFHFFAKNHAELLKADTTADDNLVFEPYLRSYVDLLTLNDQVRTYSRLSDILRNRPDIKFLVPGMGLENGPSIEMPDYVGPDYKGPEGLSAFSGGESPTKAADTDRSGPIPKTAGTDSKPEDKAPQPVDEGTLAVDQLLKNRYLLSYFLLSSGFVAANKQDITGLVYDFRQILSVLGFWVLPALFGLLGATVYQMRAITNPLLPNASIEQLLWRLALGAFAGVTIFIVFGPDQQKVFQSNSSAIGSFGLAFLFGFSTHTFFMALDKMVGMLNRAVAQFGNDTPAQSQGRAAPNRRAAADGE